MGKQRQAEYSLLTDVKIGWRSQSSLLEKQRRNRWRSAVLRGTAINYISVCLTSLVYNLIHPDQMIEAPYGEQGGVVV